MFKATHIKNFEKKQMFLFLKISLIYIKKLNTLYIIKKKIVISKRLNKPEQLQRMGINQKTNAKIILKNTYEM